jgi:hypothetical protein
MERSWKPMNPEQTTPTLRFARELSDQDVFESQSRGYLSHVLVQLGKDRLYPLFFYDAVRLQQDLEESARHGRPFVADPGMIIVQEVTLDAMKHAVEQLSREGFFDHLTPLTEADLASGNPYQWPPQRHQARSGKSVKSAKRSGNPVRGHP